MDQDCNTFTSSGVISEKTSETSSDAPVVSVVVAARNEAALIRRNALYPLSNFSRANPRRVAKLHGPTNAGSRSLLARSRHSTLRLIRPDGRFL